MKKFLLKLTRLGTTLVTVNRQIPALHSKLLDSSQLKIDEIVSQLPSNSSQVIQFIATLEREADLYTEQSVDPQNFECLLGTLDICSAVISVIHVLETRNFYLFLILLRLFQQPFEGSDGLGGFLHSTRLPFNHCFSFILLSRSEG